MKLTPTHLKSLNFETNYNKKYHSKCYKHKNIKDFWFLKEEIETLEDLVDKIKAYYYNKGYENCMKFMIDKYKIDVRGLEGV